MSRQGQNIDIFFEKKTVDDDKGGLIFLSRFYFFLNKN